MPEILAPPLVPTALVCFTDRTCVALPYGTARCGGNGSDGRQAGEITLWGNLELNSFQAESHRGLFDICEWNGKMRATVAKSSYGRYVSDDCDRNMLLTHSLGIYDRIGNDRREFRTANFGA